jgi:MiaB/RimO family radical SAM methylthiotransferase
MRKQKIQQYLNFITANGHEIVSAPKDSDVILIWTCAFRADVRDNSISQIISYQDKFNKTIAVSGCLPDIDPELLSRNFTGHIINWRNDKEKIEKIFGDKKVKFNEIPVIFAEKNICDDAEKYRKENPEKDVTFHDQFIKVLISEGCNYRCAYCSERLAFPPYRSFPEDELVSSCRRLIKETGKYEIILIADSLGEYGCDTGSTLPKLIKKFKTIDPKLKIVLNNLNPTDFIRYYDELAEFLQNGDIRHLNLPIQSASNKILKLMNRKYTKDDIEKIFSFLNNIEFTEFDTHVIIGFPGETEEDFQETIKFILSHKPKYVLTSSYMESPCAPSSKLPNKVNEETINRRVEEIARHLKNAGIICNTEGSELACARLNRLNLCKK